MQTQKLATLWLATVQTPLQNSEFVIASYCSVEDQMASTHIV